MITQAGKRNGSKSTQGIRSWTPGVARGAARLAAVLAALAVCSGGMAATAEAKVASGGGVEFSAYGWSYCVTNCDNPAPSALRYSASGSCTGEVAGAQSYSPVTGDACSYVYLSAKTLTGCADPAACTTSDKAGVGSIYYGGYGQIQFSYGGSYSCSYGTCSGYISGSGTDESGVPVSVAGPVVRSQASWYDPSVTITGQLTVVGVSAQPADDEVGCLASQLLSPDPLTADPLGTGLCEEVGTQVSAADAAMTEACAQAPGVPNCGPQLVADLAGSLHSGVIMQMRATYTDNGSRGYQWCYLYSSGGYDYYSQCNFWYGDTFSASSVSCHAAEPCSISLNGSGDPAIDGSASGDGTLHYGSHDYDFWWSLSGGQFSGSGVDDSDQPFSISGPMDATSTCTQENGADACSEQRCSYSQQQSGTCPTGQEVCPPIPDPCTTSSVNDYGTLSARLVVDGTAGDALGAAAIAQEIAGEAAAAAGAEAACVQGQATDPNPGASDPLGTPVCGEVGLAMAAANGMLVYAGQEAGCVQAYAAAGSAGTSGMPLCAAVATGGDTGKGALATGLAEVSCVQAQLATPNPSAADPLGLGLCGNVGTAVRTVNAQAADAQCAAAQTGSGSPSPQPGQTLCPVARTAVTTANNQVAQASQEVACVSGQLTTPNPSAGDPLGLGLCGAVGTAVKAANDGQADASCVAAQAGSSPPSPASGHTLCQNTALAKSTVLDTVADVEAIVTGTVGLASAEAGCLAGQVSDPDPSRSDPLGTGACGAAGGAVVTVMDALDTATGEVDCVSGQVSSPNPGNGDPVCSTAGTGVKAANDGAADVSCVAGQAGSSPPAPASGQTLCQNTVSAKNTILDAVGDVEALATATVTSASNEAACVSGQLTTPNPSAGDPLGLGLCGAVGIAAQTANAEVADAQCAAGQAGSSPPSPGSGQTLCQNTTSAKNTILDAVADVEALVTGTVGSASAEAGCVAGQASDPDPARPDPLGTGACGAAGGAIVTVLDALDTATGEVDCVSGQVSTPNPSSGDVACSTAGTAIKTVNDDAADASCVAGQAGSSPPPPASGQTLCQNAASAKSTVLDAVGDVEALVTATVGSASDEAGCIAGQASDPDPAKPDPLGTGACGAAGSAVQAADDKADDAACAVAQTGSNPPAPTADQTLCKAVHDGASYPAQEAACVESQVDNPDPANGDQACQAVGAGADAVEDVEDMVITPPYLPDVYSDDCTSPSATLVDGFIGSLYAKLLVQQNSSDAWVCMRLQEEGQRETFGGRLTLADISAPVGADSNYAACEVIRSGFVGDPSDPATYVPFFVGNHFDPSEQWVCLRAGVIQERVMFAAPEDPVPFIQDDPNLVPDPVRAPWTAGVASAACESKAGVTRLLNLEVGDSHVWADAWQSGSTAELCVRGENGSNVGGVRITVDATGSPGIAPVLTPTPSMAPCAGGFDVFRDDQDGVLIRRSATEANPVSICVAFGANQQSFTVGTQGALQPPTVTPVSDT